MTTAPGFLRLAAARSRSSYRIERELGQGGIATVLFNQNDRIMLASVTGGTPTPVESSRTAPQRNGTFSPDGRWLAFEEVGANRRPDGYVRGLDGQGGRRQVSADGGDQPRWSRGGREIIYRKGDACSPRHSTPRRRGRRPVLLFRKADSGRLSAGRAIGDDVTPDGSQFLMVTPLARRTEGQGAPPR